MTSETGRQTPDRHDDLIRRLRESADGYLPAMAAVEMLAQASPTLLDCPVVTGSAVVKMTIMVTPTAKPRTMLELSRVYRRFT